MNTNQIKCFIAVAENCSFSDSAKILFLSQSTISKNISRLEKELGFELIDRSHKHIKLTNKGTYFYSVIKPMYHKLKSCINDLREDNLSLSIGFMDTPLENKILPKMINKINCLQNASIDVEVIDPNSPNGLVQLLQENYLDLLFFQEDAFYGAPDISFLPLKNMSFSVIFLNNNQLVSKKEIEFSDLKNKKVFLWTTKKQLPSIDKLEFKLSNEYKIEYQPIYNFMNLVSKVNLNNSVGIIPDVTVDYSDPNFVFRPLKCNISYDFGVAYNTELNNRNRFKKILKIIKNTTSNCLK